MQRISPLLAALLVGACAAPPQKPAPAPPPSPVPASEPYSPAPASAPAPVAVPAAPKGPVLDSPQAIQRTLTSAIENLDFGREDVATEELQRVLQADPQQPRALSLMRQIKEDPQTLLGRESFAYQVKAGESLSSIAGRFMKDVLMFYALARYNDIEVPRLIAGGQTIRVPGKAPAPSAAPPPSPEPAPVPPPPSPVAATPPPPPPPAPAPPAASPPAVPAESKSAQLARFEREARAALARQDLEGAINAWDKVLAIDPDNRNAQLERRRVVDLCKRYNDLSKDAKKAC